MLRLLVFLACFAAVVYAVFWLLDRRSKPRGGGTGGKPVPRGPIGPDDDEDFLRELERKRRHDKGKQAKDERARGEQANDSQAQDEGPPAG